MNREKRKAQRKQKAKNANKTRGEKFAAYSFAAGDNVADNSADGWGAYFDKLAEQVKGQLCAVCSGAITGAPFSIFESGIGTKEGVEEDLGVIAVCSSACRDKWVSHVKSGAGLRAYMATKNNA